MAGWTKFLAIVVMGPLAALFAGAPIASAQTEKKPPAEESEGGGAAASDPTAGVSYLDFKPRFDNLRRGREEYVLEIEGVHAFAPSFTLKYELIGARSNRTGEWNTDLREFKLRPLYLHPIMPFGIKAKFGVGVEWFQDLSSSRTGTGTGTNEIAPLVGIGWLPTDKDFLVTLVQYFHSYHEDRDVDDVRTTGPRIIYIRSLPSINGWGKADLRMEIDHEDSNDFTQKLELQLGKMVTQKVGFFGEVFIGDDVLDNDDLDHGVGVGLRFLY